MRKEKPIESTDSKRKSVLIACRIMEPELNRILAEGGDGVWVVYLEQSLHRTPKRLLDLLQERIDQVEQTAEQIVLGYGLCSNGVVGVRAGRQGLIIPRCHDCISLFLGSPERYQEIFLERPGTYYLTPGWIAEGQDPLGLIEEHVPRYDRETARWVIEEELRHYTHITLIDTGTPDMDRCRNRAMENAAALKKQYEEIPGRLDYFRQLLRGPYPADRFIHLPPGEAFTQNLFI